MDGSVRTLKGRLVLNGYTHTQGRKSEQIFSPVFKIKSISGSTTVFLVLYVNYTSYRKLCPNVGKCVDMDWKLFRVE